MNKKWRIVVMDNVGIKIEDNMNYVVFREMTRKKDTPNEYVEDQTLGYFGNLQQAFVGVEKYILKMQTIDEDNNSIDSIDALINRINAVEHKIMEAVKNIKV